MYSPSAIGTQPPRSKRRHWTRRKKIAVLLVALMILAPFATAGVYVWQITNAIEGVQDGSVVDLPSGRMQLGGVSQLAIDDSSPQASPQTDDDVQPTAEVSPTKTASRRSNPTSIGIARDLIGTGIRADVVKPEEAWPDTDYILKSQIPFFIFKDSG